MGSHFFLPDQAQDNEWGYIPIPEVDMVDAILAISKKHGIDITNEMIKEERFGKKPKKQQKKNIKKIIHLYVDGTNLFAGQNELFGPKKYIPFSDILKDIRKVFPVTYVFFYAS